jgi:hypothetical protein
MFYVVYKQAYIYERQECTRKCMTRKDRVDIIGCTVLQVSSRSQGLPMYLVNQEVPG